MVVKTEVCFYTEHKIYPGHGVHFVRRDGRVLFFVDRKSRSLFEQKIKAQKLQWTQAWRRKNKKGKVEIHGKKKVKKTGKVFKSIQGISVDDIRKRRALAPDVRKANQDARIRAIKDKKKKVKDEQKKAFKGQKKPLQSGPPPKTPKIRKQMAAKSR
eukprot:TRINITY_DN310_c0_g1_i2.p1 TRINITY_DN310_c0_g1~~TRINITY_DN310_c0_g1_i2.p1  ORF type:complete len:157 (+),score=26.01 TRINITY_DN310_c0_g1_i2:90-560(+)